MLVSCSGLWKKSVPGTAAWNRVIETSRSASATLPTLKSASFTFIGEPRRFGSGSLTRMLAGLMSRWQVLRTRCANSTAVATGIDVLEDAEDALAERDARAGRRGGASGARP